MIDETRYVNGIVTLRRVVTDALWVLRIRPAVPISFVAGQYLALGVECEGKIIERPYSMVSSPDEPELEFFFELVMDGKLTPRLYDLPAGSKVYLRRAAKGKFVFDNESGRRNHLMAASVTGVAPFVSMLRSFAASAAYPCGRVLLIHSASVSSELGYDEELTRLASEHAWLDYVPTVSRIWQDPSWPGERGRAEDVVRKHADAAGFAPDNTTVYACGNPQMLRNVHAAMQRAGWATQAMREELYWPARGQVADAGIVRR